jgi:AcrR family transcriptional regulator
MSGKTGAAAHDRRVTRTRLALAGALSRLAVTKGMAALTVAELVREAGISRSTFYAHFNGKADFVSRSFAGMIRAMGRHDGSGRLLPAQAFTEHLAGQRDFGRALRQWAEVQLMLRAGEIEMRSVAAANLARRRPDLSATERETVATFLAGGLMGLVRAWMESDGRGTPADLQRRYAWLENALIDALPATAMLNR